MGQEVFVPPSVFNYYPPDSVLASEKLIAPEFAIHNATSAINRINFATAIVFNQPGYYDSAQNKYINPYPPYISGFYLDSNITGSTGTLIDWRPWAAVAADPVVLLEKINKLMFHGTMSAGMKTSITQALAPIGVTDTVFRAQTAVYLAITSNQYQVER